MKKLLLISLLALLSCGAAIGFSVISKDKSVYQNNNETSRTDESKQAEESQQSIQPQYSLTDPTSIWVVVNKRNSIPIDYVPDLTVPVVRLRLSSSEQQMKISKKVAPAIKEMFDAGKSEGITLVFGSGYRSGSLQKQFYESYEAKDGKDAADTYSARPGHSEHQTGLSVDLTSPSGSCHLQICWEETPEGKWAMANAYKFGFILRYPRGKDAITGYQYEPWHYRFVGKELAAQIKESGATLEEHFALPAAAIYD